MSKAYYDLLEIMSDATPIPTLFYIGIVKSKLPNLIITLDDADFKMLDGDFKIASNLVTLNNADISVTNETVTHNLKDELSIGDEVLLIKVNDTFILLSKVVGV